MKPAHAISTLALAVLYIASPAYAQTVSGSYLGVPLSQGIGDAMFDLKGPALPPCSVPEGEVTFDLSVDELSTFTPPSLTSANRTTLPALRRLGASSSAAVAISIQNYGSGASTYGTLFLNAAGVPVAGDCSALIEPGSAWTIPDDRIPANAVTAYVYSLSTEPATETPVANCFLFVGAGSPGFDTPEHVALLEELYRSGDIPKGAPAAIIVERSLPGQDPSVRGVANAAYNGISAQMLEGSIFAEQSANNGTAAGGESFERYWLPHILVAEGGVETALHIHNPGGSTIVQIDLFAPDGDATSVDLPVAVGSTATVLASTVVGASFSGSARITATQPLAIVADVSGPFPAAASYPSVHQDSAIGAERDHAIPFRYEAGGTHAVIVQNVNEDPIDVEVNFRDAAGALVDSDAASNVPPGASVQFAVANPPVGAGSIDVHADHSPSQGIIPRGFLSPPIAAIVQMTREVDGVEERWMVPTLSERTRANALAIPRVGKGARPLGQQSEIVVRNHTLTAGETSYALFAYDAAGAHEFRCGVLAAGQAERIPIDFDELGDGFLGSLVLVAFASTQGDPRLSALVLNRSSIIQPFAETEPVPPGGDTAGAIAAFVGELIADELHFRDAGTILALPALTGSADHITVHHLGTQTARIGVLPYDGNGNPLAPLPLDTLLQGRSLIVDGLPEDVRSALVFAMRSSDTESISLYGDTGSPLGLATFLYHALFLQNLQGETVAASVQRAAGAGSAMSMYTAPSGMRLGVLDPVNAGYAYSVPEVSTNEDTIHVQNVSILPVSLDLSLRRGGEAAPAVDPPNAWNGEGGDRTAQVAYIGPGSARTLRLADLFGPGLVGRLIVRAQGTLAVVADRPGSLTSTTAAAASLCYGSSIEECFFMPNARVVHAPLLPSPMDGARATLDLMIGNDLGTAASAPILIEYLDDMGAVLASQIRQLAAFESIRVAIPLDLALAQDRRGRIRVTSPNDPSAGGADLAGELNIELADGSRMNHSLIPQPPVLHPVNGSEPPELELQVVPGVSRSMAPGGVNSVLHIVNLRPTSTFVNLELRDESGLVTALNGLFLVASEARRTIELDTIDTLPDGFQGTAVLSSAPNAEGGPALAVIAEQRLVPFATATPTDTGTPTETPTAPATSPTPTATVSATPTATVSETPPATATETPTGIVIETPTATMTETPTATEIATSTATSSPTVTSPEGLTATPTATTDDVPTGTSTPSETVAQTETPTSAATPTDVATDTPSVTPTDATEAPTVDPTETPTPPTACTGDCSGDGSVTVDEILRGVNIALGALDLDQCPVFDADGSGTVTVDELIAAVNNALVGCAASGSTQAE